MYFKILKDDEFDSCSLHRDDLYFAKPSSIMTFANCGDKIAIVEIPEGEQVVKEGQKYKAHAITLKEIRNLWSIETFEWLQRFNVDFHVDDEWTFRIACVNGYLEVAQWLYGLGDVNISVAGNYAFCFACENGHLETAKWLHGLGGCTDIHNYEYAFGWACKNSQLEVAKWLYSLEAGIDIHADNEWVFRFARENGQLEIAKWLYSLGGIDICTEK